MAKVRKKQIARNSMPDISDELSNLNELRTAFRVVCMKMEEAVDEYERVLIRAARLAKGVRKNV